MSESKKSVDSHYDAIASRYHEQYERDKLYDLSASYPSRYFRLQLLLNSFISKKIKRVIEVGVGEGTPLSTLGRTGIDVWGFDSSTEMVKKSKETMQKNGMDPEQIFWGDIQDPITYAHALKDGQFDGLMAMGVMPHVENDDMVLKNISTLVRPGGSVFIEFRNKLFSLFSFNRYTADFILNDLLAGVSNVVKKVVEKELESRLRMDVPPVRDKMKDSDAPGYDAILSEFHNPFEVIEKFKKHGFRDIELLWYHYHPSMPYLKGNMPEIFRKEAIKLEHEPSNWRGYFLCSAFVVEAINGEQEQ
jgi:2-polyprenyl-3-methyl-5-hydroxy-6-metoxy-1,4-benzoquinol methylase